MTATALQPSSAGIIPLPPAARRPAARRIIAAAALQVPASETP